MPKVSVLVPIYNVEKYLRECLESLVNQTLEDIEIICINDGSTDSSLDIIKEFERKDKRIKIIDKQNSGYGNSMNIGLESATGEYIGILESDDFAKKEMYEDLYNIVKKFDCDIVKSDFFEYTTKSKNTRKSGIFNREKINEVINIQQYPNLLRKQPSIWSAIYKKDFLIDNDIRFLNTPGASYQDTSFSFKALSKAKKVVLTNKAYIFYRQDNINSSVHAKNKVFSICAEFDEITNFLNQNPDIKKYANVQKLIKQYHTFFWNAKRIDKEFRKEFIEVFSKTFKDFFEAGEINEEFFKKINKEEFNLLISDKEKYELFIDSQALREEIKNKRRKMFSIRINFTRISIVLFGKQIVEIG